MTNTNIPTKSPYASDVGENRFNSLKRNRDRTLFRVPYSEPVPTSCLSVTKTDFFDLDGYNHGEMNPVPKWFYKSRSDLLVDNSLADEKKKQFLDNGIGSFYSYFSRNGKKVESTESRRQVGKSQETFSKSLDRDKKDNPLSSETGLILDSHKVISSADKKASLDYFKPLVGNVSQREIQAAVDMRTFKNSKNVFEKTETEIESSRRRNVKFSGWADLGFSNGKLATDRGSISRPKESQLSLDDRYRISATDAAGYKQSRDLNPTNQGKLAMFDGQNSKRQGTLLDIMNTDMERMSQKQALLRQLLQK